jgi:hypothetical protein
MALPNFFCVGTQKAGTTTLYDILKQHPDIFLPDSKEAWFFHVDEIYQKGLQWYESRFFKNYNNEKIVGTITPEYMYYENVPERMYKDLGNNIRLIFVLRNPVDRAYSHYLMSVRRGYETVSFEKAVELEKERIQRGEFEKLHFSYLSRGLYAQQIKRYSKYFSKKNMKFIVFEHGIKINIQKTIKEILKFLDVEEMELTVNVKSNPASMPRFKIIRDLVYKPNIVKKIGKCLIPNKELALKVLILLDKYNQKPYTPEKLDSQLRHNLLKQYFYDDIRDLEEIIEKDLSLWYNE